MRDSKLKYCFEKYQSSIELKIEEKISVLRIRLTFSNKEVAGSLFSDLFLELLNLPSRDVFRVEITEGAESGKEFKVDDSDSAEELQRLCEETIDLNEEFSILVEIEKNCVNGYLSVYFIEKLNEYFFERHPLNLIRELSLKFKDGIHFVVFSPIKQFGSRTIFFAPSDASPIYVDHRKRLRIINKFKDSSSFLGYDDYAEKLLPADFYAEGEADFLNIKNFFEKAFFILAFAFISNHSEIKKESDNKYQFLTKIHGYKSIDFDAYSYIGKRISLQTLYKIYDWIYQGDSGNVIEKIGLVRNLISLHASDSEEVVVDDVLWQAVKSNYKVYLKENVEVYLEAKSKIAEVLTNSVEKTQEIVESVIGSIRAAIGVLVTFLLTVVLINGFKDVGEALKTFSIPYVIIVFIISVCAWYWVRYSIKDAVSRFNYSSDNIDSIILSSYKNILLPSEIVEATLKVRKNNLSYLEEYTKKYQCFWNSFLILFCSAYLLGTLIYLKRQPLWDWIKSTCTLLFGATEV